MSTTHDEIVTSKFLCRTLYILPGELSKRLAEIKAVPIATIDGIAHYDASVVERLRAKIVRTNTTEPMAQGGIER